MEQHTRQKISLGFTDHEFEAGIHICQVFDDNDERQDTLLKFLISAAQTNEKACCFSENMTDEMLTDCFKDNGLTYNQLKMSGALTTGGAEETYFQNGTFNPDKMINLLKKFYECAIKENYKASRVIGEMTPKIQEVSGNSRLLEYESKVNTMLKKYPVTCVCQYDARLFDGATILDILKVHPYIILHGTVVTNPFFTAPEEYLTNKEFGLNGDAI